MLASGRKDIESQQCLKLCSSMKCIARREREKKKEANILSHYLVSLSKTLNQDKIDVPN